MSTKTPGSDDPPTKLALRQSEETFHLLVDSLQDYAVYLLDAEGRVISWNFGAERLKGYKAEEIIDKHFSCFYTEEDILSGRPQRMLEIAAREGRLEDEGWRVRKDGSRFWANAIITARRDGSGKLLGFSKITRDITERMRAQEALRKEVLERREAQQKLHESENSLRQLSLHLLRTQDEDRRRIGREMHDSLGQYLTVLKMTLDSLKASVDPTSVEIIQETARCASLVEECMTEVRTISYLLYPPMLDEMGLKAAIPWYLEGFTKRSGIRATFEIPDDYEGVSRDVELALFRVLQESLTNVHRHSGSATADIRVLRTGDTVILEVRDQGRGLPAGMLKESGQDWAGSLGVGLRGMNERLHELGGRLEIFSIEVGTVVRATIPLQKSPLANPASG